MMNDARGEVSTHEALPGESPSWKRRERPQLDGYQASDAVEEKTSYRRLYWTMAVIES